MLLCRQVWFQPVAFALAFCLGSLFGFGPCGVQCCVLFRLLCCFCFLFGVASLRPVALRSWMCCVALVVVACLRFGCCSCFALAFVFCLGPCAFGSDGALTCQRAGLHYWALGYARVVPYRADASYRKGLRKGCENISKAFRVGIPMPFCNLVSLYVFVCRFCGLAALLWVCLCPPPRPGPRPPARPRGWRRLPSGGRGRPLSPLWGPVRKRRARAHLPSAPPAGPCSQRRAMR